MLLKSPQKKVRRIDETILENKILVIGLKTQNGFESFGYWPLVLKNESGKKLLKLPYPIKEVTLEAVIIPGREEQEKDRFGHRHHVLLESAAFQTRMELGALLPSKMSGRNVEPRSVKRVSNGQCSSWNDLDEIIVIDIINAILAEVRLIQRYISIVQESNPTPRGKPPLFAGEPISESLFSVAATDCSTPKIMGRTEWLAEKTCSGMTLEQDADSKPSWIQETQERRRREREKEQR